MNNAAIHATARLAELHRADIARDVAAAATARRTRATSAPNGIGVPAPRRHAWPRWLPAPRPAL